MHRLLQLVPHLTTKNEMLLLCTAFVVLLNIEAVGLQGLETLMDNVTNVAFTSCALRHNATLPDLALPEGADKLQSTASRSRPSTGTNR